MQPIATAHQFETAYARLTKLFPQATDIISPPTNASVDSTLPETVKSFNSSERSTIMEKLRSIHRQSVSSIEEHTLLYLEQQISDLVGMTVSTEFNGIQLPYIVGQIEASLPYPSSPSAAQRESTSQQRDKKTRSYFGWIDPQTTYGIVIPFQETAEWTQLSEKNRLAFAQLSAIVINPVTEQALVAKLVDVGPYHTQRYQFSGTPKLLEDGGFWSPGSAGLAAVFLLENSGQQQKLGPILLDQS